MMKEELLKNITETTLRNKATVRCYVIGNHNFKKTADSFELPICSLNGTYKGKQRRTV